MILFRVCFLSTLIFLINCDETRDHLSSCAQTCVKHYLKKTNRSMCLCWFHQCSQCPVSPIKNNSTTLEKSNEIGIPQPQLLCNENENTTTSIYVEWAPMYLREFQELTDEFIYVIQIRDRLMETNNQWSYLDYDALGVIRKGFRIEGLKFDWEYQLRVTAVSKDGLSISTVFSDWLSTLPRNVKPSPPTNITYNLIQKKDIFTAWLSWNLPSDYSCWYNVTINDQMSTVNLTEDRFPVQIFPVLKYNLNYSIGIFSINSNNSQRSDETEVTLVPTCLNYNICEPALVEIVTFQFVPPDQIEIKWNPPINVSASNPVQRYNVTLIKRFSGSMEYTIYEEPKTTTANETSINFTDIEIGYTYVAHIDAISLGGISETETECMVLASDSVVIDEISSTPSPSTALILAIVMVLLIPTIIAIWFLRRFKKTKKVGSDLECCTDSGENIPDGSDNLVAPTVEEICHKNEDKFETIITDFVLKEVIGHGAFGIVRRGYIRRESRVKLEVAVKMLKKNCSEDDKEQLVQEIEVLKNVGSHPNVVRLIACCTIGPSICLAVEFCAGGDLLTHLRKLREQYLEAVNSLTDSGIASTSKNYVIKYTQVQTDDNSATSLSNRSNEHCYTNAHQYVNDTVVEALEVNKITITPTTLISYARQIATGMEYLSSNKFIHRDLACRNILLTSDDVIKISDFGLTRDVYERNIYQKTTSGKLPLKWMAPESIHCQIYTTKSDVWSFGIVLWEITTLGCSPYPAIENQRLPDLLSNGYRMGKPDNCSAEIYQMMNDCWLSNINQRPTFSQLKLRLEGMLESNVRYLNFSTNN